MVRKVYDSNFSPYSAWHRTLDGHPPDVREMLKMIDIDVVSLQNRDTVSWWLEYNWSNGPSIAAIYETVEVNQRALSNPIENLSVLPERYPVDDHKLQIYSELAELVDRPVFILWCLWEYVDVDQNGEIRAAHPEGFYIHLINEVEAFEMTERQLVVFLKDLHMHGGEAAVEGVTSS